MDQGGQPGPELERGRRSSDQKGIARCLCWCARRLSEVWDWIDARDIDKHVVSAAILLGTVDVTKWGMAFAALHPSGSEMTIAAVLAPYSLLQAAAIKFYFDTRK